MAPNPFFARLGLVSSPAGSLSNLSVGVGTALDATNRTGFYFDSAGEDLHIVANAIDAVVIDEAGVTFNVPITVDGGGPTTLNAPLILEQTTSGQDWLQFSDGTTTLANFQRAGTDVVFEVDGTIGVSVGGTQRLAISTTLATFSVPVSAPSLSINGSNVNGIATSTVNSATAATVGQVYLCNTSGAGFAVTLPLASTVTNQWVWIKKTSADANTLTIATTNPDLIDGAATQDITTQNESVIVVSNGSGWLIF